MRLFRKKESQATAPEAADGAPDSVPGERGIASVNRAPSLQARVSNVVAFGLMAVLAVGFLGWYYGHAVASRHTAQTAARAASRNKAQGDMTLPPLGRVEPPAPASADPVERALGPAPEPPPATAQAANAYGAGPPAAKTPAQLALERQLAGPVLSTPSSSATNAPTGPAAAFDSEARAMPTGIATGGAGRADPAELAGLLKGNVTAAVPAQVLPTQRLLLPKGAFLDCTLETAIDSTLPGMTTCVLATDSFSADGSVVLLERGSKLVGETRGQVRQGSARIFVLWTEARTPKGVIVPLASPGTDELGRSGLPGEVDRHFWDRFGAAILVSVIDGGVQAGAQSRSGGGGTVIYNPSASRDVMTEVLRSTIDIPPTVTKANGDRIQVLVARDLDFRSVYELRPIATRR